MSTLRLPTIVHEIRQNPPEDVGGDAYQRLGHNNATDTHTPKCELGGCRKHRRNSMVRRRDSKKNSFTRPAEELSVKALRCLLRS